MKKLRFSLLSLAVVAALLLPALPARAEGLELTAPSAVLMEASTGRVLFEKDPHAVRSCASITKVMTLCLVFEAIDSGRLSLDQTLTASAHAASMGGSDIWLEEGGGHVRGRPRQGHGDYERQRRRRGAGRGGVWQRGGLCGPDERKGPAAGHERHGVQKLQRPGRGGPRHQRLRRGFDEPGAHPPREGLRLHPHLDGLRAGRGKPSW